MADYFVGVDLGQAQDYTAVAVVGFDADYLRSKLGRELEKVPPREPVYEVRHLERIPLGSRYSEAARRVHSLMNTPPLENNAQLVVGITGVGIAAVEILKESGLYFKRVLTTAGEKEVRDGRTYRVPKRDLITASQVLLQDRRLKIAAALAEAKTLTEELLNFRYKAVEATNDAYLAWREGANDDLVLALSLAVWEAKRPNFAWISAPSSGPFFGPEPDWGGLGSGFDLGQW